VVTGFDDDAVAELFASSKAQVGRCPFRHPASQRRDLAETTSLVAVERAQLARWESQRPLPVRLAARRMPRISEHCPGQRRLGRFYWSVCVAGRRTTGQAESEHRRGCSPACRDQLESRAAIRAHNRRAPSTAQGRKPAFQPLDCDRDDALSDQPLHRLHAGFPSTNCSCGGGRISDSTSPASRTFDTAGVVVLDNKTPPCPSHLRLLTVRLRRHRYGGGAEALMAHVRPRVPCVRVRNRAGEPAVRQPARRPARARDRRRRGGAVRPRHDGTLCYRASSVMRLLDGLDPRHVG
jgi:hypothetical protein